ncbi:hypothetical protein BTHERMOSOX_1447 [Bathymodiolus thermophilus thioautotrophic gill symbiont]|nr:hypothetical protein BTHERMOSOX_1447 [Bathymodiolus thermophilus thioautotrophic gill symbiont]
MSTVTRGAKQCDGWDGEHLTHNNSDWNDCDGWWHQLSTQS